MQWAFVGKKATIKNKIMIPDFFEEPDDATLAAIEKAALFFQNFIKEC